MLDQLLIPEAVAAHRGGPLAGIKVLDLTQFGNGPSATAQLSDNGADVLKVEPPEGEGIRPLAPPGKYNMALEALNRGKRSMVLDLKHPGAKEVMKRLVEWADVATENFRPGVLDRLGYGYEDMKKWNPNIVFVSNSGFGPLGEWAQRASFDGIAQAFNGVMTNQGGGPSHRPQFVEWGFSDEVGAMNFYSAILNGLAAKYRFGKGQRVTTSQTAATLHFQRPLLQTNMRSGHQRDDGLPPNAVTSTGGGTYRGSDGKWFAIALGRAYQFQAFCENVLGAPALMKGHDGRTLKAAPRGDNAFGEEWKTKTQAIVGTKPISHWLDLCGKYSCPAAPCSSYADIKDPENTVSRHLRANGYIREEQHRDWGTITTVEHPTVWGGTPNLPVEGSWHAPDIGEHTSEVLQKMLGFAAGEVSEMMKEGGASPPPRGPYAPKKKR